MPIEYLKIFTPEQGNFLLRLLIAHFAADFALQTKKMVDNKAWLSSAMGTHIFLVFAATLVLGQNWQLALIISAAHWLLDGTKTQMLKSGKFKDLNLFILDQLLHILTIILCWAGSMQLWPQLGESVALAFHNYNISLLLLGYLIVIWPIGYLIKFLTRQLTANDSNPGESEHIQHGGMRIGQFERIIILTLVLLQQYAAIGFLITGKSIIRFAGNDEKLKSEYVLVGTMMSYAMSIVLGVLLNLSFGH